MVQSNPATVGDKVVEAVTGLVRSVVEEQGFELVEVQFRPEAGGLVLRLVIFNKAGIGVDDCAKVSREVSHLLDVEDIIGHPFRLEVSSPGLDWPLRSKRDFERYKGRKIKLITSDSFGNKHLVGVIENVIEEHLCLVTAEEIFEIPIVEIVRGNLVIDF